jgi:hypothetical protein
VLGGFEAVVELAGDGDAEGLEAVFEPTDFHPFVLKRVAVVRCVVCPLSY